MITIYIDGSEYEVNEDAILGHVLHEVKSAKFGSSYRGLFCGMGICFECVVKVDDDSDKRSCMTKVYPGMQVKTNPL